MSDAKSKIAKALMKDPEWEYGSILPIATRGPRKSEGETYGDVSLALPDILRSPLASWTKIRDQGFTNYDMSDVLNVAGMMSPMGVLRGGAARSAAPAAVRAAEQPAPLRAATHGAYAEDSVKGAQRAAVEEGLANLKAKMGDDTFSGQPLKWPEYKPTPTDEYMKWADEAIKTPEDKAGWARFLRKERALEGSLDPADAEWLKRYEAEMGTPTHPGNKTLHEGSASLAAIVAALQGEDRR